MPNASFRYALLTFILYATLSTSVARADAFELLWVEPFAGYSYVNLTAISNDNLYPKEVTESGEGLVGGVGAGLKLLVLSLGGRFAYADYSHFDVGTAVLEAALHLDPLTLDPYLRAAFGYAWLSQVQADNPIIEDTSASGVTFEVGAGIDVPLGELISLGLGADLGFLRISRDTLDSDPAAQAASEAGGINLAQAGDAWGLQARIQAHVVFHLL